MQKSSVCAYPYGGFIISIDSKKYPEYYFRF